MPKFRVFEIEEKKVVIDHQNPLGVFRSVLRPMWEAFDTLGEAEQKLETYPVGGEFTILPEVQSVNFQPTF
jgi:hypothetical protein